MSQKKKTIHLGKYPKEGQVFIYLCGKKQSPGADGWMEYQDRHGKDVVLESVRWIKRRRDEYSLCKQCVKRIPFARALMALES